MESAVVMCGGDEIELEDLPPTVSRRSGVSCIEIPMGITLDEAEKIIVEGTLAANGNNKSKTAEILGIGRKTLHRKLDEWKISGGEGD